VTASSIALGTTMAGTTQCPASGTWDHFLAYEQSNHPEAYTGAKGSWSKLQAAGAVDGALSIRAANPSDCDAINTESQTSAPVVNIAVIHFTDEASAIATYKGSGPFGVDVAALSRAQAAGGSSVQGSETGLGENAIIASIPLDGAPTFEAYWQSGVYLIAIIAFDVTLSDGTALAHRVAARAP